MSKLKICNVYSEVKTKSDPIVLEKHIVSNNAIFLSINEFPFIAKCYKSILDPTRLPDSIQFANFLYKSINLTSLLFPLFFYSPQNQEEKFNYFLTSGIFALGLIPIQYATKPMMLYFKNLSSIQTPQIYLYGVLGSLTGLTVPLLVKSNYASLDQMFTSKTFTNALCGYGSGIIMAFAINSRCQLTYQRSSIVCMYTLSGIIIGAFFGQFFKGNPNRNILSGILLGGWSGLLFGTVFDQLIGNYLQLKNRLLFAELNLHATTAIPIIIASKGKSRLKNTSVPLIEFNFRF